MTGATRFYCPLDCGWHHDQPDPDFTDLARPYPDPGTTAPEGIDLAVFRLAAEQLEAVEAAVHAHVESHGLLELVQALMQAKAERDRLTAELDRRPLLTCGASMATGIGDPVGPCTLRYNHDGPVHQGAAGARWWTTTAFATGASPGSAGYADRNPDGTAHIP